MDLVTVIRRVQRKKAEREQRASTQAFCQACGKPTHLVSVADAIKSYCFTLDEISQRVADGTFHRLHNSRGEILFCYYSLRQSASGLDETQPMRTEFLRSMKAAA